MCALALGPLQTHSLIGRENEQTIIRAAVEAAGLRVIFVKGEAGIGKTRLVNEMPEIFKNAHTVFADLIDLYHVDVHTISGIEKAIADSLDPDNHWFVEYRHKRKRFERLRRAGSSTEELEKLHAQLGPQFVENLNALASERRVVLRFDTAELVQSEQEIHPLLASPNEMVEVQGWLKKYIPELENVVVVFAGRPQGALWDELRAALREPDGQAPTGQADKLIEIELGPLGEPDVPVYFADLAQRNKHIRESELTAHYTAIYDLTGGRPLHLAFVAALLARREKLPDALLAGLEQGSRELNTRQMLEEVWNLSPDIHAVLPFVAWLRKGVDGVLLSRVMTECLGKAWTPRRTRRVLADLRELPFAKTRPHSNLVFLHDEMYDLMDRFILKQDVMTEQRETTCRIAVEWYESAIARASDKRKQRLTVEQLYYHLLADPDRGFERYQALSDEALIGREVGFEMALRDEVLRFFLTQKLVRDRQGQLTLRGRRIARDSASRRVQRLLRQGKNQDALDLADRIWAHDQFPFERDGAYLFPCVMLAYRGEALAYLGHQSEAIAILQEAIKQLQSLEKESGTRREQIIQYMLGLARKNLGFAYTRRHIYDLAAAAYLSAIETLDPLAQAGMQSARLDAAHIRRNLAFVYSEQGRLTDAKSMCDKALQDFRELGYRWGEALTQNVYGGIEYRFHHLHRSLARCQEALRLSTQIQDRRSIGLSRLWAGRASRKLGAAHTYEQQAQSQAYLLQAQKDLAQAREVFEKEIVEPARLLESIAEQAKLYRDWAKVLRREGQDKAQVQAYTQQAEELFNDAIRRADEQETTTERADYRHDLADLYAAQQDYDRALALLEQAEQCIEPACILSSDQSMTNLHCPLPGYLEIMAKICASRGHIQWARGRQMEAIDHWSLAFVYLYAFSPGAGRFREEIADDVAGKLADTPLAALQDLRARCQAVTEQHNLPSSRLLIELDERIKTARLKEQVSHGAI